MPMLSKSPQPLPWQLLLLEQLMPLLPRLTLSLLPPLIPSLLHLTSHAQTLPEKEESRTSLTKKGDGDNGGGDDGKREHPLPVPELETSRLPEEEMRR